MIGSHISKYNQCFNSLLNEILVRSKQQIKFQTRKKNILKYYIQFSNYFLTGQQIWLKSLLHTLTPTTDTPATNPLCNTRPYSQRWHSLSQTLNRLKKVISNFYRNASSKNIFSHSLISCTEGCMFLSPPS